MNSTNKITKSFLLMHIYLITMIASALLFLVTRQTHAMIITVEPDDFPRFHDLTNVDPHVTFSVAKTTGEPTSTDLNKVVVIDGTAPSTGSFVFGRQIAAYFPDQYWFQSGLDSVPAVLRVDFSIPTDFVSIDIIDIGNAQVGQLQAFSASGNLQRNWYFYDSKYCSAYSRYRVHARCWFSSWRSSIQCCCARSSSV